MDKKHIFITGGTSGIGLSLAEAYLKEGHHVGICGRDLSKIPAYMKDQYPFMHVYELDINDRKKVNETIVNFSKGRLDLVIANAGIASFKGHDIPDFDNVFKVINTNVLGVMSTIEASLKVMLPNKKGHLVVISSVAGEIGLPRVGQYSASKAAVTKYCEALAIDLKKYNIVVTTILPGFIDTPLTRVNKHYMPFLMSSEKATKLIKKSIDNKAIRYVFPRRMKWLVYILSIMPRRLYRTLMGLVASRLT
ncbi:MAG: hypothetical protein A2202_02470 [Bdellovibrionales bacterium RIFOXYA1_FULL_36_14]|nr:MAG: hypothetical protein A2202_02470 [Bdellovibrionales bacterium RIFOXYA1_FULL_36_14]